MRSAVYSISVDGTDVSNAFHPMLLSLSVRSDDQNTSDELTLELDDSNGQIELPRMGAAVTASLGWSDAEGPDLVFQGTVDQATSGGSRDEPGKAKRGQRGSDSHSAAHHGGSGEGGGAVRSGASRSKGRTLTLTAKSVDQRGKPKERRSAHLDNMTFGTAAQTFGQKAGLSVKVDSSLASIQRAYWSMTHESFLAWGARTAAQLGATFKVYPGTAIFVSRKGGSSVSGQGLEAIEAAWGVNLIEASISPILSRPDYGAFATRWYDPQQASWQEEKTGTGSSDGITATHRHATKAPTKDQAAGQSGSNQAEVGQEKGSGTVTIDGEPAAMPGAPCSVSGVRPGVDGTYKVSAVEHTLSRSSGFVTRLTLKQPGDGVGTDDRTAN